MPKYPVRFVITLQNDRSEPEPLLLEPLGEEVRLQPGERYDVLFLGPPSEPPSSVVFKDKYIAVWVEGSADAAVFHKGVQVAGFYPAEWPSLAKSEYDSWIAEGRTVGK
jgi:hypothetical protein